MLLRQVENHGDRLNLRDGDKAGLVGGAQQIALIDQPQARAAVNGGADGGVIENGLGIVDGRLIGIDLRDQLGDNRALRVGLLLGGIFGAREIGIAFQIAARIGQLRLVLCLFGQSLIKRGLIGFRVDLGQNITGFDGITVFEMQRDQASVDLRSDGDGVERLHGADAVELNRHIGPLGPHRQHGQGTIAAAAHTAGPRGRCRGSGEPDFIGNPTRNQGNQTEQNYIGAQFHGLLMSVFRCFDRRLGRLSWR